MKKYKQKIFKTLPYIAMALLVGFSAVYAGTLTPPGAPEKTMYSLTDIWNLAEGTTTSEGQGVFETPALSETGKTLTEVYTALSTEIEKLTPSVLVSGNTIFGVEGEASSGPATPEFALADATTYSCEALATDLDQPALDLETICGYHTGDGCSWSEGACIGGIKTPANGYMTWYAGTASCSEKIDEGSTSWRLATYPELVGHYLEYNDAGAPPDGFVDDSYWSGTTHPSSSDYAYSVGMGGGYAGYSGKKGADGLVHCAH